MDPRNEDDARDPHGPYEEPYRTDRTEQTERTEQHGRFVRRLRLAAIALVLAVAVVVVVTVQRKGPPSRQDLLRQAGLVGKQELLIGVKHENPGLAFYDSKTGRFTGFDVDIALMIAADLGFRPSQVRFLPIEDEDRPRMQARDPVRGFVTVDLVVASYSITDERERLQSVSFSAPYLSTEVTVMTLRDRAAGDGRETESAESMSDFAGKKVCTIATSTAVDPANSAGVILTGRNSMKKCVDGLYKGEFDAVTTDAALLAGFVGRDPARLRLHDIGLDTQENYGVNTGGDQALLKLVNLSLYESRNNPRDRRWEDAFDRNLAVNQHAALPQQVAIAEQPAVPKVDIRQWPWETG